MSTGRFGTIGKLYVSRVSTLLKKAWKKPFWQKTTSARTKARSPRSCVIQVCRARSSGKNTMLHIYHIGPGAAIASEEAAGTPSLDR